MSSRAQTRLGFVLLALAVAAVALLSWWPSGSNEGDAPRAPDRGADDVGAPDASRTGGVAAREVTTAAVGRVTADVVDGDGAPVDGGTIALRCLGPDGDVRPIAGGTVGIDDGRVEGPGCRGTVCATLHHAGLVPAEPWVLRPGHTETLRARGLARIEGDVLDARGDAVAGATIVVTHEPGDDDPGSVLPFTTPSTGTDADGMFALPLVTRPPCDPCDDAQGTCADAPLPVASRVLVVARAPGFGPAQMILDLDAAPGDARLRLVLPEGEPPLTGTLADPDGQVYPRAFVLARSLERTSEQHRAEADDGTFSIPDLGSGAYAVRAIQDGIELATTASAAPGDTVDLLGPEVVAEIVVELVDEDDRPLGGVRVDGGPFSSARTDKDGRVRAHGVAVGTYMLKVKPPRSRASAHILDVESAGTGAPDHGAADRGPAARTTLKIARIRVSDTR